MKRVDRRQAALSPEYLDKVSHQSGVASNAANALVALPLPRSEFCLGNTSA
jgi:hypothetical protein